MVDPTEVKVPVQLDKPRVLLFNLNAYCAYEEASGKFFLDTIGDLYEAARKSNEEHREVPGDSREERLEKQTRRNLDIVRSVSMSTIRDIIWSGCQEYDDRGEPVWPMTATQLGRFIGAPSKAVPILLRILAAFGSGPTKEEADLPTEAPKDEERPTEDPPETNGGSTSGESREDILDSLTLKSES